MKSMPNSVLMSESVGGECEGELRNVFAASVKENGSGIQWAKKLFECLLIFKGF